MYIHHTTDATFKNLYLLCSQCAYNFNRTLIPIPSYVGVGVCLVKEPHLVHPSNPQTFFTYISDQAAFNSFRFFTFLQSSSKLSAEVSTAEAEQGGGQECGLLPEQVTQYLCASLLNCKMEIKLCCPHRLSNVLKITVQGLEQSIHTSC